ncbi:hypothetical protein CF326_g8804 [Tilletia indica]|nr:hypothetical protein CF326_g8804 [Tilletia indica]
MVWHNRQTLPAAALIPVAPNLFAEISSQASVAQRLQEELAKTRKQLQEALDATAAHTCVFPPPPRTYGQLIADMRSSFCYACGSPVRTPSAGLSLETSTTSSTPSPGTITSSSTFKHGLAAAVTTSVLSSALRLAPSPSAVSLTSSPPSPSSVPSSAADGRYSTSDSLSAAALHSSANESASPSSSISSSTPTTAATASGSLNSAPSVSKASSPLSSPTSVLTSVLGSKTSFTSRSLLQHASLPSPDTSTTLNSPFTSPFVGHTKPSSPVSPSCPSTFSSLASADASPTQISFHATLSRVRDAWLTARRQLGVAPTHDRSTHDRRTRLPSSAVGTQDISSMETALDCVRIQWMRARWALLHDLSAAPATPSSISAGRTQPSQLEGGLGDSIPHDSSSTAFNPIPLAIKAEHAAAQYRSSGCNDALDGKCPPLIGARRFSPVPSRVTATLTRSQSLHSSAPLDHTKSLVAQLGMLIQGLRGVLQQPLHYPLRTVDSTYPSRFRLPPRFRA